MNFEVGFLWLEFYLSSVLHRVLFIIYASLSPTSNPFSPFPVKLPQAGPLINTLINMLSPYRRVIHKRIKNSLFTSELF